MEDRVMKVVCNGIRKHGIDAEASQSLLQLWNISSYEPVLMFGIEQITIFYSCEFKFKIQSEHLTEF